MSDNEDIMADVRAGWRRSQMHSIDGGKPDKAKSEKSSAKLTVVKGKK